VTGHAKPAGFAAVVLTGGAARRMGGVDKPALPVGGSRMRDRVLAAVAAARPRIVVGPADDLPPDVLDVREQPAGGGPVAALAAGLALLDGTDAGYASPGPDTAHDGPGPDGADGDGETRRAPVDCVAVLAGDLPLLTAAAVHGLRAALDRSTADGAVYVDDAGHPQWLCGVWRPAALRRALDRLAARHGGLTGTSVRALMAELTVAEVSWLGLGPPPWFDCDTDEDLRRAEEWTR
jgi:molybdopterin-guanine dinucleotide biosynthesis protein A